MKVLRAPSSVPDEPASADEEDRADDEYDRARPLPESVIGHALDHEGRERRAADRQQDRGDGGPERNVGDARQRAEINRAHDMAEGLRHRLGGVGGLAVEHALLKEDIEEQSADAG